MQGPPRWWAAIVATLLLAAFVVPFTVLRHVRAWYGSFLFWCLFALAVIGMVVWATRPWGET